MNAVLLNADAVLRGRSGSTGPTISLPRLLILTLACGASYGAVMGAFGGIAGDRVWQLLLSAAKVPMLLMVTFALGLPSFFVLNTLLGLRSDFPMVLRALVTTQAAVAIVLASLAPYTAFWYASFEDYQVAILFNGIMFAVASIAGHWLLRRLYAPLIARSPRHRVLMKAWLVIYAFVGIQLAWILRPFVGDPTMPIQILRADTWGNAYVIIARMIWRIVTQ